MRHSNKLNDPLLVTATHQCLNSDKTRNALENMSVMSVGTGGTPDRSPVMAKSGCIFTITLQTIQTHLSGRTPEFLLEHSTEVPHAVHAANKPRAPQSVLSGAPTWPEATKRQGAQQKAWTNASTDPDNRTIPSMSLRKWMLLPFATLSCSQHATNLYCPESRS